MEKGEEGGWGENGGVRLILGVYITGGMIWYDDVFFDYYIIVRAGYFLSL